MRANLAGAYLLVSLCAAAPAGAQPAAYPLFPLPVSEQSHQLEITVNAGGRAHGLHRVRLRNAPGSGAVEGCFFLHTPLGTELESLEACRNGACRRGARAELTETAWELALVAPLASTGRPIARAESDSRGLIRVCAAPIDDTMDVELRVGWVAPLVISRGHSTLVLPPRIAGAPDGRLVHAILRVSSPDGLEVHAPPFAAVTRATRIEIAGLAVQQAPAPSGGTSRQALVALRPRDVASSIKLDTGSAWSPREGAGITVAPGAGAPSRPDLGYIRPPDPRVTRIGNVVPRLSGWTRPAPPGLSTATLRRLMRHLAPAVSACVLAEQQADPRWRPRVFRTLLRDGAIADLAVDDAPSPRLRQCLGRIARSVMVPDFSGSLQITYPTPGMEPQVREDPSSSDALAPDVSSALDDALRSPLPAPAR